MANFQLNSSFSILFFRFCQLLTFLFYFFMRIEGIVPPNILPDETGFETRAAQCSSL
jgi:hypothetical protein